MYNFVTLRRSVHSPLTPIPPLSSQTSFDFSQNAINRCLEASNSTTPTVLKPRRSFTPGFHISTPDISPIDFLSNSMKAMCNNSPNVTGDSNSSLNKGDDSVILNIELDKPSYCDISNINNRHLNISAVLDDLGLNEYKQLFEVEEIDLMAFMLLTDDDFQELGVKDEAHRETFSNAIKQYYDNTKTE